MQRKPQHDTFAPNEQLDKSSEQIRATRHQDKETACWRIARKNILTVRRFNKAMQKRIKIKDIAGYCMVSTTTVRRWIEGGKLHAIRLPGGHYRISQVDYRSFLKSCEIPLGESSFESKSKRKEAT